MYNRTVSSQKETLFSYPICQIILLQLRPQETNCLKGAVLVNTNIFCCVLNGLALGMVLAGLT